MCQVEELPEIWLSYDVGCMNYRQLGQINNSKLLLFFLQKTIQTPTYSHIIINKCLDFKKETIEFVSAFLLRSIQ